MTIQILDTALKEVKIIEPRVFGDERGFFFESYNARDFERVCPGVTFLQDNHSKSAYGVVRGLSLPTSSLCSAKARAGTAWAHFDVAVDVRRSSPTFAQWVGVELTETNFRQLWIPEGFAHGFVALSETAEVAYKCTNYWVKEAEASIRWNDPTIGITWPLETTPLLSEKDLLSPSLDDARLFP